MVDAANTVTYYMANDVESFNKEMENDSIRLECPASLNKKTGVVLPASSGLKVCGLHIGCFADKIWNVERICLLI
jgi:hypothetical protein